MQGAVPAIIKGTENNGSEEGDNSDFEEISWDEFFKEFEKNNLALLHESDGKFSKLISRD